MTLSSTTIAAILQRLATRRAVQQPAAADVQAADVATDAETLRATIVRHMHEDEQRIEPRPPFTAAPVVARMPDWRPGHPFGMARSVR